jgi:pre-rRNA-processing protein IPI3
MSFIVSAGDDAVISVWNVYDLVDSSENDGMGSIRERHSFTDHSLAVTSVFVGHGGVRARIFSASLDRTARVFEIASKQMLYSVAFPTFLISIVASPDESCLFLGGGDGVVFLVNLTAAAASNSAAGSNFIESADSLITFEGHTQAISKLLLIDQGTVLLSSSEDGTIRTWDVASRQCIRTIDMKAPVTCMALARAFDLSEGPQVSDDFALFAPLKKFGSTNSAASGESGYLPMKRHSSHYEVGKPLFY